VRYRRQIVKISSFSLLGLGLLSISSSRTELHVRRFPAAVSGDPAISLNNMGQLVTTVNSHGYLRQRDGSVITFDYPGIPGMSVTSINNNGQILGSYRDTYQNRPFLRYPDGSYQLLPQAVEDGAPANLTAVNDNQDLVGVIHASTGYLEGYEDVVIQDTSGNILSRMRMPGSHDNTVTRTVTALNNSRDFVAYNVTGGFSAPFSYVGLSLSTNPHNFPRFPWGK
jgi:hypothetical protein